MSEKRQQILEALGDVPGTISTVESYLENFHSDETLSDLIIELYVVILGAIEGMMQWLVDKTGCKYMLYKQDLSDADFNKGNKSRPCSLVLRAASHWTRRLQMSKLNFDLYKRGLTSYEIRT